jgi:hypothetical protein
MPGIIGSAAHRQLLLPVHLAQCHTVVRQYGSSVSSLPPPELSRQSGTSASGEPVASAFEAFTLHRFDHDRAARVHSPRVAPKDFPQQ